MAAISMAAIIAIALCGIAPEAAHAAAPSKTSVASIAKSTKSFTVKWKKNASSAKTGYQIRYCANSNMKSGVKTVSAPKGAVSKKVSSGVKPATTYYVQIRVAYKAGSKTRYTGWSAKKSVTTMVGSGNSVFDKKIESILSKKVKKTGATGLKRAFDYVASLNQGNSTTAQRTGDWKKWSVPYAKAMADKGRGNCYQAASLMAWLAKGLGYDARAVDGSYAAKSGPRPHGWAEIKVGRTTYIFDANNQNTVNNNREVAIKAGSPLNYFKVSKTSETGKKYMEMAY